MASTAWDIVLLATDLTISSRLQGATSRIGARLHSAASVAKAEELCSEKTPALLIIDLAMPNVELSFINKLKADAIKSPRIVAFGPHVHEARLAAAEAAGCDVVLSRGAFWSQIDALLANAAG